MAELLKCSVFIAEFDALYCGMSTCCQEDLSVVQWEGIRRECPILRRLNEHEFRGFAHGVDKTPRLIFFLSSLCPKLSQSLKTIVKHPREKH